LNNVDGGCGKEATRVLKKIPPTQVAELVKLTGETSFFQSVFFILAPRTGEVSPVRNKPIPKTSAHKLGDVVIIARGM
jgi:hypothetical protein